MGVRILTARQAEAPGTLRDTESDKHSRETQTQSPKRPAESRGKRIHTAHRKPGEGLGERGNQAGAVWLPCAQRPRGMAFHGGLAWRSLTVPGGCAVFKSTGWGEERSLPVEGPTLGLHPATQLFFSSLPPTPAPFTQSPGYSPHPHSW